MLTQSVNLHRKRSRFLPRLLSSHTPSQRDVKVAGHMISKKKKGSCSAQHLSENHVAVCYGFTPFFFWHRVDGTPTYSYCASVCPANVLTRGMDLIRWGSSPEKPIPPGKIGFQIANLSSDSINYECDRASCAFAFRETGSYAPSAFTWH